jgi:AAA domain/Toprim domain
MSAATIARALGGTASGTNGWYRTHCPVHQSKGLTLAIRDGRHGLIVKCHGGCSRADILAELTRLGLIVADGLDKPAPDPEEVARRYEADAADRQRRIADALDKWCETVDATNTSVEVYLWSRLCCISPPPTIRLHRSLYHRESGQRRPAMVALVEHVKFGPVAVHATYLRTDGSGKAALDPVRKIHGPRDGAGVRLGPIGDDGRLIVGEGLESVLSMMISTGHPGWAALCADGITKLILPAEARHIIIAADHDANGVGQRAAEHAARRFRAEGRRVKICLPPVMGDWNDVLLCPSRQWDITMPPHDIGGMADIREAVDSTSEYSALWVDGDAWSEADLPRRPWIAPGYALRGAVTVMAGPPSAMKSSMTLAWAVSIALHKPHGDFRPTAPGKCIVYNVEDDKAEQRRRLSAALRQFVGVAPCDISGKVIRVGPTGVGTLFTRNKDTGVIVNAPAMDELRQLIDDHHPDVLVVDPLAELHTAEENDNTALRAVIAAFRSLAAEFNIAVILLHHTRKGAVTADDPDTARGASAIIGGARIVLTLVTMSEEDAKELSIPTSRQNRSRYVRLDDAKQNYAAIDDAQWYEKALYHLDNGEVVVAALPWTPPDIWRALTGTIANRILDDIEAGLKNGQRYSNDGNAQDRAVWKVVQKHAPDLTEEQAREVIKTWVKNKVLVREPYHDPIERKDRQGLFVKNAKRAGAAT